MTAYLDRSLAQLEQFEGSVPWMYRDTVGKVTVGVGQMLADEASACALAFQVNGRAASRAEIATEFARVAALPEGRAARFYWSAASPELSETAIRALLRDVLTGFESDLRAHLVGYDQFPEDARLALLDMAYNLGPEGLLHGYPRLIRAVTQGNWAAAAAACYRHGPSEARNEWTRKMFLGSVLAKVEAETESALVRVGYGLLGVGATAVSWVRRHLRR